MAWVGGQLLLSGVVLPVLRANLEPRERGPLIHAAARRFGTIANIGLLPLLVITGVAMALERGVDAEMLTRPGYGRLLSIKLIFVFVSIVLAAVHGILATRHPRSARPLAITGLGTSLITVVFATALVPM